MSWLLLTASSVFLFTSMNLLQKVIAVDNPHPRVTALVFNSIATTLAIGYFVLSGSSIIATIRNLSVVIAFTGTLPALIILVRIS